MHAALSLPSVDSDRLLAVLREETGGGDLGFAEPPRLLATGGEAVVEAFRLSPASGVSAAYAAPLVLRRVLPRKDPKQVLWEAAVCAALAELSFPVPRVLVADADAKRLGAAFLVAERVPGRRLLEEVLRPSTLLARPLRLPRLFWDGAVRVPRLLGETQARLHALDPEPLRRHLRDRGFEPSSIEYAARVERLVGRIESAGLEGLAAGADWLRAHSAPGGESPASVICHGDLLFTNLHVEGARVTGVFDWTHATLAEPAYDVAATLARLESNIPDVPAPLRALFLAAQRRLARGYLAAYRRKRSIDAARVRTYEAFWLLNELAWSGESLRAGATPDGDIVHRWLHRETIEAGVERFAAITGVRLAPELP